MRELLEIMLSREGYLVACAENGQQAISMLSESDYDLILCDIRLGDITGLDVLRAAKTKNQNGVVIMISAYATAETAVEAMNQGAYDYVPKPFDKNELKQTIKTALEIKNIEHEREAIEDRIRKTIHFGIIVGNSPGMHHIYGLIRQVAKTKTNILISGESGTGKELIAHAIHEQSERREDPFMVINCGGIPETLMESELFGHRKGAFTGAAYDKKGLFELADKGTVFLDEIGELSARLQVKLLRVVQEKVFKTVGGNEDIAVNIRIISATNKTLEEEVIAGLFREDLFYRLNVIEIRVPPLRERKDDIPALAQHFLEKYSHEMGKRVTKVSSYAIDLLCKYDFPGNVRELENLIERSVALTSTNIILPDSLALSLHKRRWVKGKKDDDVNLDQIENGVALDEILLRIESEYIKKALDVSGGNKQKAAALLGMNYTTFLYRLERAALS